MTRLRKPLALALGLTTAVVLASCSQAGPVPSTAPSASPSTAPSASPSTAPSTSPSTSEPTTASRRIDVVVAGRQVTPTPEMVNIAVGQSLTIAVTSDHDNTLHAHGFNIERDIKAGQQLEITVKGAQPGVYDIELHDPELRLLQVAVR